MYLLICTLLILHRARIRGDTWLYCHYQIFFEDNPELDSEKLESMKSFKNISRVLIKPGTTNEMHFHNHQEQVYFVLQRGVIIKVGEEKN